MIYETEAPPRDANHTIRYFYLRVRRGVQQNISADFAVWYNAMAAVMNAGARVVLGCAALVLELMLEGVNLLKEKCR